MIPLTGISQSDINQWCNQGWVFAEGQPRKYYGVEDGTITCLDEQGNTQVYPVEAVQAHWPQCGAVNIDGYAIILNRNPRQQYRRTYNSTVLEAEVPRKWDVMKAHGTDIPCNPDDAAVVRSAFQPRYYDYAAAIRMLDQGWVTVAMSPYIILAGNSEEQLLYYRGAMHGTISNGELIPCGEDKRVVSRLLKFFDGRVNICASEISRPTLSGSPETEANSTASNWR